MVKFLRTDYMRHSKLGKNRKKLQRWRRAKGIHSKIRKRRKGYPAKVVVGYKSPKSESGKIQGMAPVLVNNLAELQKITNENIAILSAKIGARKKLEMIKYAEGKGIKILNVGGKK